MNVRHIFRNKAFIIVLAGIFIVLGTLAYLVISSLSTFDALVEYTPETILGSHASREWGSIDSLLSASPLPVEHNVLQTLPTKAPQSAPFVLGGGLDKVVETSFKNPVNRKLSFFMVDRTLQQLKERATPGTFVRTDLEYMHALFDSVRTHLNETKLDESGVRRALQQVMVVAQKKQVTDQDFDRMVLMVQNELGVMIDPQELGSVLDRMRQPGHRNEMKMLLRDEAGKLAQAFTRNPVSRRMSVFVARQFFSRYKEKICKKLPAGMSCDQAAMMFEQTMQNIVRERINGPAVGVLAGRVAEMLIDRRITPREMEQLLVFIKQAGM